MTPQTADFRTKYKTLSLPRALSLTLVLYFIFPAAHVGLSCNCSRKKPRGSFLWWRAPSFSRRKRLESNNFSLLLFWCGHSFPRITSRYLLGLRCALGLKRTPPPCPCQIYRSNCHTKSNIALSRYMTKFFNIPQLASVSPQLSAFLVSVYHSTCPQVEWFEGGGGSPL